MTGFRAKVCLLLVAALGWGAAVVVSPPPASATTYYPKSHSDRPPVGYTGGQTRDSTNPDAANAYTQRDFPAEPAGTRYDRVDAALVTQATSNTTGYFYADSFYFAGGDSFGGYIGVQTKMINCTPTCVNQGHGVVASIWGATKATPTPGLPVIAVSDVEVGRSFKSLHFTYNWIPGHVYRTALIRDETIRCLGCNSWTAGIVDDSVGGYTVFGTFSVPDGWDKLLPRSVEFDEEYDPSFYPTCTIPVSRNDWTASHYFIAYNPTTGTSTSAVFASTVGDYIQTGTGCTNSASFALGGGAHRHVIGALT